ncbi:MAG: mechanosensitive ion channel family protein [Firmicutes bacterium]|nr:mechanosensitive ion channel family protein [Bacillota bacterium]MCM1402085.1 mechanosensitive ion channel family protein [Bacteroides sp.]MCM1477991.1 mechanosensitive ion channel family protein [Bacteroides sp.]
MFCEIIPSHQLASWLLTHIDRLLDSIGFDRNRNLEEIIYVAIIVAFALFIGWVIRKFILWATRRMVAWHKTQLTQDLLDSHILSRCSHIIPPLVIMALLPFAFDSRSQLLHLFKIALYIYTVITFTRAIIVINTFLWTRFDRRENTKNLPLRGILNVCNGFVWAIAAIVIGSILLDKSPVALLTGIGAFATVLMLIFKDSILGFVAGIQLSQNDMLRVGDWIVVPSTIANGIVIDVSLTAVKVQNWDNTIVTLPPYTLVSTSFQNYRGMSDSGWRLISKTVPVDAETVVPATDEIIARVQHLPGMDEYINKIKTSGQDYNPGVAVVNGSIETNLGLLRAYMCYYLLHHKLVGTDQQILVNITSAAADGLQLQIYCYTTTAWTAYEAVKSEIFEHLVSIAPLFSVRVFNSPSGTDLRSLNASPQSEKVSNANVPA